MCPVVDNKRGVFSIKYLLEKTENFSHKMKAEKNNYDDINIFLNCGVTQHQWEVRE